MYGLQVWRLKLASPANHCDPSPRERRFSWRELLEFAFATEHLRRLCLRAQIAERRLGKRVAEKLRHRLSDLRAAENVADLPIGKPTAMPTRGELGVDLIDHVLVFVANHDPVPLTPANDTDWTRVTRIQFLRLEAKNVTGGGPRG